LIIELLHKLGNAEVFTVENLETDPSTLGKPLGGKGKPKIVHLVRGHQNGLSISLDTVGNLLLLELLYDLSGVFSGQIRKQRAVVGLVCDHNQRREQND
jgi:hypothetical protein